MHKITITFPCNYHISAWNIVRFGEHMPDAEEFCADPQVLFNRICICLCRSGYYMHICFCRSVYHMRICLCRSVYLYAYTRSFQLETYILCASTLCRSANMYAYQDITTKIRLQQRQAPTGVENPGQTTTPLSV